MQEDRLTGQLRASAAQFAQSGLRARLDQEWGVHQLHIATALELLAKARLASLHGSLIAAKDFDSLLHLSGHPRHAKQPPDRIRTITVTDALVRVGQVVPSIENLRSELKYLADVRNGVVHAGHLNSQAQDRVLLPFITACDLLLDDMEASRDDFWGEYVELVDTHRAESVKAAEVEAAEAITLARIAFAERFAELDEPTRKAILASIVEGYAPEKYEQDLYDCPACSTMALVHGSHDVDWEPEWEIGDDGEPWSPGASFVVTFRPGTLECRACGLVLDGPDQLTAAGVPESWEIEDADPRDFLSPTRSGDSGRRAPKHSFVGVRDEGAGRLGIGIGGRCREDGPNRVDQGVGRHELGQHLIAESVTVCWPSEAVETSGVGILSARDARRRWPDRRPRGPAAVCRS